MAHRESSVASGGLHVIKRVGIPVVRSGLSIDILIESNRIQSKYGGPRTIPIMELQSSILRERLAN